MDVRLVDRSWGAELASCNKREPTALHIICPFIKRDALREIIGDEFRPDIRVITRFDLEGFAGGVSDISALTNVLAAGGEARGIKGLHSKVFIFGNAVAAVTSANLTRKGLNLNAEFGCISELPEFVKVCADYFDCLWQRSEPGISPEKLREWEEQVTQHKLAGGKHGTGRKLPDHGIDVGQGDDAPTLEEAPDATGSVRPAWLTEALHAHVKFFGRADNRVPWSFPVLDEIRRSGSHWACSYHRDRRPRSVQPGDVMYLARMVRGPNDYLIYGRAEAMAYQMGRDDASPQDIAARPWKTEYPHYIRVHDPQFIAGALRDGIPLYALTDALGSDSFPFTQQQAAQGSEDISIRSTLRRRPGVPLTDEAFQWLNDQFDAALRRHGRVPAEELAELDWPTLRS